MWLALAIVSLVIGASVAWAMAGDEPDRPARTVTISDPANTKPGELNQDAVTEARIYTELPILWLGETFRGLNLVAFQHNPTEIPPGVPWAEGRERTQTALLVYGTCEPRLVEDTLSCAPPLEIYVGGPGLSPAFEDVQAHADWSSPYTVRGVPAIDAGSGTILYFDSGITITIHSNSDIRQEALAALRLANADALDVDAIGPGASLSPLNSIDVP